MKLTIVFLSIFILVFYLYKTNATFNNMYDTLIRQVGYYPSKILQKDIESMEALNSTFQIKLTPNYYGFYLNCKYEFLPSSWHKTRPVEVNYYKIITNIIVKNSQGNIIYSKTNNILAQYGWLRYEKVFKLHNFTINEVDTYTIDLNIIDTNINNIPKNLMNIEIKADVSK